jgi:hypothetical protein
MDSEPGRHDQDETPDSKKQSTLSVGKAREETEKTAASSGAENADNHKNPAHYLKILLRGHSMLEWINLGFTLVLVLVGIFYTFYAAKQWQAMQASLRKTDESLELTRQALDLNRRQTVATENSAKAANDSISLAQSSSDSSTRSFQTDQPPYLVVSTIGFATDTSGPISGKRILVNITFKNVGKTPAIRIRTFHHLAMMPGQPNTTALLTLIDKFLADAKQKKSDGEQDVPPGADSGEADQRFRGDGDHYSE